MFDFFKDFLRGTNSTEVERQLCKKDGHVSWGNPPVEVYDAYHAVISHGSFSTFDGITVTFEGNKMIPHSQTIVLTKGDEVLTHRGYHSAENVGLALSQWRKA